MQQGAESEPVQAYLSEFLSLAEFLSLTCLPPWVAKEKIGTLLLASEMPVPIPRNRTVHIYICALKNLLATGSNLFPSPLYRIRT